MLIFISYKDLRNTNSILLYKKGELLRYKNQLHFRLEFKVVDYSIVMDKHRNIESSILLGKVSGCWYRIQQLHELILNERIYSIEACLAAPLVQIFGLRSGNAGGLWYTSEAAVIKITAVKAHMT